MDEQLVEKPKFKSITKKKTLRKPTKEETDIDDVDEDLLDKIEEMKTIQKLRSKHNGIEITALLSESPSNNEEVPVRNKLIVKTGGLVDMSTIKDSVNRVDDAYDTGIGTQFSAETNKRDEDDEMMKYIEEQLLKRKGKFAQVKDSNSECTNSKRTEYFSPEEAALQALPEHLRVSSANHSEEMLSNQMLSGIPEVDLGIEAKIKNIEATEEAKLRLLWEKQNKTDGPSSFVPSNMAVNFVQHNRFNLDDHNINKKEKELLQKRKLEKKPADKEQKATDDYHYERFKKQFRRY